MSEKKIAFKSIVTCPSCGFQQEEIMPEDACVYFYECRQCKHLMKPNPGDCCIFCSFGSVPCPPIQGNNNCCY